MHTARALSTLSLVLSTALAGACAPPAAAPGTVAFVGVAVLPMDREGVLEDQTVVVVDGRIAEMGPASAVRVGSGATIVDGAGPLAHAGPRRDARTRSAR
jgi:imidazolonepropionase-like amidohydrolase